MQRLEASEVLIIMTTRILFWLQELSKLKISTPEDVFLKFKDQDCCYFWGEEGGDVNTKNGD